MSEIERLFKKEHWEHFVQSRDNTFRGPARCRPSSYTMAEDKQPMFTPDTKTGGTIH